MDTMRGGCGFRAQRKGRRAIVLEAMDTRKASSSNTPIPMTQTCRSSTRPHQQTGFIPIESERAALYPESTKFGTAGHGACRSRWRAKLAHGAPASMARASFGGARISWSPPPSAARRTGSRKCRTRKSYDSAQRAGQKPIRRGARRSAGPSSRSSTKKPVSAISHGPPTLPAFTKWDVAQLRWVKRRDDHLARGQADGRLIADLLDWPNESGSIMLERRHDAGAIARVPRDLTPSRGAKAVISNEPASGPAPSARSRKLLQCCLNWWVTHQFTTEGGRSPWTVHAIGNGANFAIYERPGISTEQLPHISIGTAGQDAGGTAEASGSSAGVVERRGRIGGKRRVTERRSSFAAGRREKGEARSERWWPKLRRSLRPRRSVHERSRPSTFTNPVPAERVADCRVHELEATFLSALTHHRYRFFFRSRRGPRLVRGRLMRLPSTKLQRTCRTSQLF